MHRQVGSAESLSVYDALVLQYNPFLYGRWGIAPGLVLMLTRLHRMADRPRIAIMVHELAMPLVGWRWTMMGLVQRAQFLALRPWADVLFTSIESLSRRFRDNGRRQPCVHLPVASTVPDMRACRRAERARLGADPGLIVLAAFGTDHPSRLVGYVAAAVNGVAKSGHRVLLLNLGAGAPPPGPLPPDVRVFAPGLQPAEAIGRELAAADVFLAPFVDGASTRRTTLMAALQHGLPVITTDGRLTDEVLRRAPQALRLTPVSRPDLFAAAVVELACQPAERSRLGNQARKLYEDKFDWPILTGRLLAGLQLQ